MLNSAAMLTLLAASLMLFAGGAAGALVFDRESGRCRRMTHGLALCGTVLVLILGIAGLTGNSFELLLPRILPLAGGLALGLDRLSAFFLLTIAVGVIPSTLFAVGYTRQYRQEQALLGFALNVFVPAMMLVVLSRNVLTFLVFWEAMSLASYFLVMTEKDRDETRSAGWLYMVMTHAGLACLLIGFLAMLQATGSFSMPEWARAAEGVDSGVRSLVFLVMAAGFLSKAGAIPFHVWLPRAHPAAPSHVSAMMSGVMIKLGVYGLIRIGFEWLGPGPGWWGVLIMIVGAVSALLGVLYALIDSDLKCLLAYSSVENIGVILLGVGAGLVFRSYNLGSLAALALMAALYHSLNHTVFKGLLFLSAGSVVHVTGTRITEEMGGLLKRMPHTGAFFLIGSLAISAMPPFNGFISEWLTFQSLLLSFRVPEQFINLVFALCIASLALTAGLAAACFVRAFGITFLALPRGQAVEQAHEADWTMRTSMGLLALACLTLGVAPVLALRVLSGAVNEFLGAAPDLSFDWSNIAAASAFGTIAPLWVAVILALLMLAAWVGLRVYGANFSRRYYETWGCGRAVQTADFEYTAAAFANPFKRVFAFLYRPVEETEIEAHSESRFFVKTITYRHESRSIIEDSIYAPIVATVRRLAAKARTVQSGNVHGYLLYILAALLTLLLFAK
ncbi:MAG: hydrogenase 4 subunit B [Acidobacteria bacterium]|nr:MAG: hydrogenase 4 subunit B [Acidobacteriota bacterium]